MHTDGFSVRPLENPRRCLSCSALSLFSLGMSGLIGLPGDGSKPSPEPWPGAAAVGAPVLMEGEQTGPQQIYSSIRD